VDVRLVHVDDDPRFRTAPSRELGCLDDGVAAAMTQETGAETAVRVMSVETNSPAARAGVREGDVIIEFGGHPIAAVDDLHRLLTRDRVGQTVAAAVIRRNEKLIIDLTPTEKPG
jgi:S1-C subfamily serine protease